MKKENEVVPGPPEEETITETVTFTIGKRIIAQERFVGFLVSDKSGKVLLDSIAEEGRPWEDWVVSFRKNERDTVILTIVANQSDNNPYNLFSNWSFINPEDGFYLEYPEYLSYYRSLVDYHFKIAGITSIEAYWLPGAFDQRQADVEIKDDTAFISYEGIEGLDQILVLGANNEQEKKMYYQEALSEATEAETDWASFTGSLQVHEINMPFSTEWDGSIYAINSSTGNRVCIFNTLNATGQTESPTVSMSLPDGAELSDIHFRLRGKKDGIHTSFSSKFDELPSAIPLDFDPEFDVIRSTYQDFNIAFHNNDAVFYKATCVYQFNYNGLDVGGTWEVYGDIRNPPKFSFPTIPAGFLQKIPHLGSILWVPTSGRSISFYKVKEDKRTELANNPLNLLSPEWNMDADAVIRSYGF